MEERKIDPYQIIGFVLIAGIFTWMLYVQPPVEQSPKPENQTVTEQLEIPTQSPTAVENGDEITQENALYDGDIELENDLIYIAFNAQGGFLKEVRLKTFQDYKSHPIYIVKDANSQLNFQLETTAGMPLNTRQLAFAPIFSNDEKSSIVTLVANLPDNKQIHFKYTLPNDSYLLDFEVDVDKSSRYRDTKLSLELKGLRQAKSVEYENRYTELKYRYEDDKVGSLSAMGSDDDQESKVKWVAFNQHFFSMILIPSSPFEKISMNSENLVEEESEATLFTKNFLAEADIANDFRNGHFQAQWYIGPSDYEVLKKYPHELSDVISFGWGIFGWINRYLFFPLFGFLSSFLPYGIAIIVMTIIVRFLMSPITYKTYLSQAKMKVLRPEITEINDKFKSDAVKRQQETMKLYGKAGVSPMAGCVPALLQMPVFLALFYFFPVAFQLRNKSFLWAEDLSSYDAVAQLPFNIPFYGDHVSLFPILASIAIFFYTTMTTGQQMQAPQPGMPNMKFIMYLMPLMMLFFFNNYASGLSLYYFVSNLITIIIMLVIKNFIIDEEKIHLQIQENKKKPRKQNRFQRKMQEMMEEAEKQQKARGRK